MGFGLFGKLPQKRDFVALNIPRQVLEPFETWLQSCVAASRNELGPAWQDLYLVAPIWRFWIGADIFGLTCAGALMPSVDRVGRYFPLAMIYCAEPGQFLPAPPFDPLDEWYGAIEGRLLSVLGEDAETDVDRLAEGLAVPNSAATAPEPTPSWVKRGNLWRSRTGNLDETLSKLAAADYWAITSQRSYWWHKAADEEGGVIYTRGALPDPFFYVDMIKGDTEKS